MFCKSWRAHTCLKILLKYLALLRKLLFKVVKTVMYTKLVLDTKYCVENSRVLDRVYDICTHIQHLVLL